ncbi:MAG: glycyl-radical enzyme activating protein [Oscillospiraceae bacterium]|nr:glycyl-radical enzyme activating protein [Oscillospiraceae bacterium]
MQSFITEVQRFSLHDGPGIRTTVFFKGCNMRCSWCHNPETLATHPELMFYENKCIGCGKCFKVCPTGAHKIVDGKHVIDRKLCTNCGKCAQACYAEALVLCGKPMDVDAIMNEIRQDKPYYESSNGGATFSGGEVLCSREAVSELIDACRKEGIHAAIETNLSFPFETVQDFLKKPDLIMCDLKLFDDEKHREYTGVSNAHVLENIEKLDTLDKPFIVRTPLIPGVTDTEENIAQIARFLKPLKNLVRYELLNFNPLGAGKYDSLDRDNAHREQKPLGGKALQALAEIASHEGVKVKVM